MGQGPQLWFGDVMLMLRESQITAPRTTIFRSLRAQALVMLVIAVLLPALVRFPDLTPSDSAIGPLSNSILGSAIGALAGLYLFRRVTAFPGTRSFGYILPSYAAGYGAVVAGMFIFRLDYSRIHLTASLVLALAVSYFLSFLIERYVKPRFWVVPAGKVEPLLEIPDVDWVVMTAPVLPTMPGASIVADLRFDLAPEWERMLAEAALSGRPVYHTKQLRESLTGRVSIEHLSENSFGSLMPNLAYVKVKRTIDLLACAALLPVLVLPLIVIAALVYFDSPGGIIYRQERMGHRGRNFAMYKFRTMRPREVHADEDAVRDDAMTKSDDARITRIGRFLRKVRLDELPQLFNVLRGEMSLIGPRPEAVPLSRWYESELPFYSYRHIVRPGISGWAQVHQGHVTDLDAVHQKLTYDFYYIKNFSAWLDILIALRTIPTMLSGFGSK